MGAFRRGAPSKADKTHAKQKADRNSARSSGSEPGSPAPVQHLEHDLLASERAIAALVDTLRDAQRGFLESLIDEADERCVIITERDAPGRIVACSKAWTALCGFGAADAIGLTPAILQGDATDASTARAFMKKAIAAAEGEAPVRAELVNYAKNGRKFTHCLATTVVVDPADGVEYHCTESYERAGTAVAAG